MRLLIVGDLEGHITTAGKIAFSRGATVSHIDSVDAALSALRSGRGAELLMIDVKLNIANLVERLASERISIPVVACGTDANAAVASIRAGAKEYIPLSPDAELIAAVLEAVAEESSTIIHKEPAMQAVLDEISAMHPRLQAKLLRAVREREIDRVGGAHPIAVDVRILVTSNRNLEEAVKSGDFREDLYFRLNVVIPPLRNRPADIMVLAGYFGKKYAQANGVEERPFTPKAAARLKNHGWRGNVRELENAIHRAILLAQSDEIDADTIMLNLGGVPAPADATGETSAAGNGGAMVGKTVAEVERDLIIETLHHCLGNRTHAATILGISIRTLRNKLKQYSQEGVAVPMPGEI